LKASDLFVRQLEEEGVEYIFGLPGEENLDFLESLRTSKIKLVITRHEQAAAFMAATYGRLTGKAGVCFSTLGPGATNLVTGVAHAQLIGAPLVAITGQKAVRDNWQAKFQLVDIVGLMRPITKHAVSIADPSTIPTELRNAFKLAQAERPGAVHVELPEDVAGSETEATVQHAVVVRRPDPDREATNSAAELINAATHPLLILSAGANRKHVWKELREFVEQTGIHVVHTQMGKGVLSDHSAYSLFATGIHKRDYVNCGIDRADVIIAVGYNIIEYPPYVWNADLAKKIIHIGFTEADVDKYYDPAIEMVGDISVGLRELGRLIRKRDDTFFKALRSFLIEKLAAPCEPAFPPTPQEIICHVREVLADDDIVALDNGIYKLWFSRLYKTYEPNTFLVDNALATMGAGLPAAIAAKLVHPERKVLAVVGDGGFMMNAQELETAVRMNIPVAVLILNDNAFGFIKWKQKNMGFPDFGLDYTNPDFARFAESHGAAGITVRKGDDLRDVLLKAFDLKKVAVIECPIDYSTNYETFTKEIEDLACDL
jgi:acetolactate synthase-1/2/3 large subunit